MEAFNEISAMLQECRQDLKNFQELLQKADMPRNVRYLEGMINACEIRIRAYATCLHIVQKHLGGNKNE